MNGVCDECLAVAEKPGRKFDHDQHSVDNGPGQGDLTSGAVGICTMHALILPV